MFFTAFAQVAPEVAALAERRHPALALEYALVDRATAFRRLHAAELDVALVFEHPSEPDPAPPGIELLPLFADPATVLLAAGHRLAARPRLTLDELAGEPWVRAHDGAAARLLDRVLAGRRPRVVLAGRGDEPVEGQVYVAAGAGVMLAHALNVIVNREGIAVRPLTDAPPRRVQAAIAADQQAPAARAALALLTELR
jgi:LysR substrate binding domain